MRWFVQVKCKNKAEWIKTLYKVAASRTSDFADTVIAILYMTIRGEVNRESLLV